MVNVLKEGYTTFKTIFTGMGVTWRHLFKRSVTLQYPDERAVLPDRTRNKLYVNIDDCIGCNLCARACPVNCIDIETVKVTSDVDLGKTSTGNPKRLWVTVFDIDLAKCMYCDLCVYPCPTECIYMVPEYEYSEYVRSNLIYHFSNLTPDIVAEVKEKAEKEAEEKKKKKQDAGRKSAQKKTGAGDQTKAVDQNEQDVQTKVDGQTKAGDQTKTGGQTNANSQRKSEG